MPRCGIDKVFQRESTTSGGRRENVAPWRCMTVAIQDGALLRYRAPGCLLRHRENEMPVTNQALSANFSLMELCRSQLADRHGIDNAPDAPAIDNLRALCVNVLQKVRDHYGKPVHV